MIRENIIFPWVMANNSSRLLSFSSKGNPWLWGGLVTAGLAFGGGYLLTQTWTTALKVMAIALPASYGGQWVQSRRKQQRQQTYHLQLERAVQGLELRLMDLEHYEEQIYQTITSAQEFSQSLEIHNQTLRTERFYLSEQIANLQTKRQELVNRFAELTPQKKQLEQELKQLCANIEQASDRQSELEKSLVESTYNVKIIENSCEFIREELAQLKQEIFEKVQERDHLRHQLKELAEQSQSLQKNIDHFQEQKQILQTELDQLHAQKTAFNQDYQQLSQRLDSLHREEEAMRHSLKEKRQEMQDVENCLTFLRQEYYHFQADVADMQGQVSLLTEESSLNL